MRDTIYALASARGRAGVAVIRISGPQAINAARGLTGAAFPPRQAVLRQLSADGAVLDQAVVIAFPGPGSFTGEDVVELQLHGSTAVVSAVLAALGKCDGLRMAQAGEFTRRALENGRMDLAQVEGLADLIEAETEAQRRQALRLMQGDLSRKTAAWRAALTRALALLEASIDFADEDVPEDVYPEVRSLISDLVIEFNREITGVDAAERIRAGFEIAIVGHPNSGKSTLLNRIAGRDIAITSEIAGTTRDVIEVQLDLRGLAVTMLDTAGLRDTEDEIEAIGVDRARQRAEAADLRVFLITSAEELQTLGVARREGDEVVFAKADQRRAGAPSVSGKTGEGLEPLLNRISETLDQRISGVGLAVHQRHQAALMRAVSAINSAIEQLEFGAIRAELTAEDLRVAVRALDSLIGKVDVEQLLDVIFSSFCIGK